jgi:hypothetical protein
LDLGDVIQFAVTTVSGETWRWSSSDTTKAAVDQTGKVRAVGEGSATVTALSNLNHLSTASVFVQGPAPPLGELVIRAVNQLPANAPANLSALFGTVEVVFSAPAASSASLVITRPSGDTTVSSTTIAGSPPASIALQWNTAGKATNGATAFPNGSYVLRVVAKNSTGTVTSALQQVTVANP